MHLDEKVHHLLSIGSSPWRNAMIWCTLIHARVDALAAWAADCAAITALQQANQVGNTATLHFLHLWLDASQRLVLAYALLLNGLHKASAGAFLSIRASRAHS